MNVFNQIRKKIKYKRAIKSSSNFISYLKGNGVVIGDNCYFQSPSKATVDLTRPLLISIGNHCRFLENFTLLTHDSVAKVFGPVFGDFLPSSGKVSIGNNVYFARNCTVLKGVSIGDNCIIGFGSVITHDIPSNSVAVGSPARVVCSLEQYYEKRKRASLEEAQSYIREIVRRTGKRPSVEQMYEEFPFWLNGFQDDKRLKFSVEYQTKGFYHFWKENHIAPYKSFDEFVDSALTSIDNCSSKKNS